MLISQSYSESDSEQGSSPTDFAELRSLLAHPADMDEQHRQRLMVLARRLARVRALGDEYNRVGFSNHAMDTLLSETAVI